MITIHFSGTEPLQVTKEELLALCAFELVRWDDWQGQGIFRACTDIKAAQVHRFLKAFNA